MAENNQKRLQATIEGRVQGVGFRMFTVRTARTIGALTGRVKNLPDGSVELVAEGPIKSLEQLLKKVQQGPSRSKVKKLDLDWSEATGEFTTFDVKYR